MEENWRWVRTVVRARLADDHVADDVMQEVALAVLGQNGRPVDPDRVQPWLYRVALRTTINHFRRVGRQRRLVDNLALHACTNTPEVANPRDWALRRESNEKVAAAVEQLPPRLRTVLMLKYTEQWTYGQLAEHLGVSIKTIEYRLLKGREALRGLLSESGLDTTDS